jgi:hypothetical protein
MSIGRFRQPSYLYGVGIHKLFTDGVRVAVLVEANGKRAVERTLPNAFSANHRSPYASIKVKLETCTHIFSSSCACLYVQFTVHAADLH